MIFSRRNVLWLTAGFSWLIAGTLFARNPTNAPAVISPGPMPTLESPVDFFRELLAMEPAERRQSLSNRPPEVQKKILAKVREYASLKPDERELRLRTTELQWYMQPLMSMPRTNREFRLALIPDEQRKLVEERLTRWDLLPLPIQEELLNNEMTARYFAPLESATEEQKQKILSQISPERRAKLEAGLERWRGLSAEQREKTLESFNAVFELTPKEKQKVLGSLSAVEQQQMEKTLQSYAKLPVQQRMQCMRSFEKFAGMSLEERQAFLKNAERWKLMSPSERESWRELVKFAPLQPAMPSGNLRPPMPPPIHRPSSSVATNTN
jgi:Protein of unknown function (DUF3106)